MLTIKNENTSYFTQANSGCLGIVCRRRTRMAAIVVGELSRSSDPAVSEWGNPILCKPPCVHILKLKVKIKVIECSIGSHILKILELLGRGNLGN
jgi:hypothetical protein